MRGLGNYKANINVDTQSCKDHSSLGTRGGTHVAPAGPGTPPAAAATPWNCLQPCEPTFTARWACPQRTSAQSRRCGQLLRASPSLVHIQQALGGQRDEGGRCLVGSQLVYELPGGGGRQDDAARGGPDEALREEGGRRAGWRVWACAMAAMALAGVCNARRRSCYGAGMLSVRNLPVSRGSLGCMFLRGKHASARATPTSAVAWSRNSSSLSKKPRTFRMPTCVGGAGGATFAITQTGHRRTMACRRQRDTDVAVRGRDWQGWGWRAGPRPRRARAAAQEEAPRLMLRLTTAYRWPRMCPCPPASERTPAAARW